MKWTLSCLIIIMEYCKCGIDVMEITPVQEYVLHMRNDQMSGSKPGNTEKAFSR